MDLTAEIHGAGDGALAPRVRPTLIAVPAVLVAAAAFGLTGVALVFADVVLHDPFSQDERGVWTCRRQVRPEHS